MHDSFFTYIRDWEFKYITRVANYVKAKAKAQVLGIAPLNMRSMCQRRFTIVEVVTDQHVILLLHRPITRRT